MTIRYDSNNSGGSWWLSDKDWKDLEKGGWKVEWFNKDDPDASLDENGDYRWLGALAGSALFEGTLEEAIESFEKITGQDHEEEGCTCCGEPHQFYELI